ncbi:MAG: ATP-binding protein [Nocardioides sp.]
MAIDVVEVNDSDAERLLALVEGHFTEVKATQVTPTKLSKAMSALANAEGGDLYVGIDENGGVLTWNGFEDVENANAHLQVLGDLFPLGEGFEYEFYKHPSRSGLVLHVLIAKSGVIKRAQDGKVYVRRGAQSLPVLTDEALRRLERAKGLHSFETEPVQAPLDEVTNSSVVIDFMLQVVPTGEPEAWLRKQQLIAGGLTTVAGLLLFSDEPQIYLPKRSSIKIYRYKTTDAEGSREQLAFTPITIEGCLYNQISNAVAKVTSLVEEVSVLTEKGLRRATYPVETLHEIIANAVLHRDYEFADDIHVRIFDNRIEVESPGRLPAHITENNILTERFSRNGMIVRLINKFPDPPNKDVGEGLNTAFEAMKKLKLKDPLISQSPNAVLVNIRHERLGTPEEIIMEHLKTNEEINNRTVRALTGIGSENKVKVIFQGLMSSNQIERVPGKGGGSAAYQLKR